MLELAARELRHGDNQYPAMRGVAELRQAVADHDRRFYGLDYDFKSEIIVTCGATEAWRRQFWRYCHRAMKWWCLNRIMILIYR